MPEQSQEGQSPIPGGAIPQEDSKANVGSPQSGEATPAPQANEEVQKPAEQPAPTVKEQQEPTGEDLTSKLYREVQSLKDKVTSQETSMKEKDELIKDYVPLETLEDKEKQGLEHERAKLDKEKEALERARLLDSLFKLPEFQDLKPFEGDIKGSTEESIRIELNERRSIVEAWKARANKGPTGGLPSAQSAKGATGVTAEAAQNMSAKELENVLPQG